MAQPVAPNTDHPGDRPSPRARRAQLKRRVRWLLAAGSAVTALGIYVGLAVPLPLSGGGEVAMTTFDETLITVPTNAPIATTTAVDDAPVAPTVTPTQATPVSRSSGS